MELDSESEMKIYELFLINKYAPKFNTMDNRGDEFTFELNESWQAYERKEQSDAMDKADYKLYNFLMMHDYDGGMITDFETLARSLNWKTTLRVEKTLNSLKSKGYADFHSIGSLMYVKLTEKDLEFE